MVISTVGPEMMRHTAVGLPVNPDLPAVKQLGPDFFLPQVKQWALIYHR